MDRLPEEVWERIIFQLRLERQIPKEEHEKADFKLKRQTLRSLALTSKTLRRLTQPILHRTFSLGGSDSTSICLLLRTLTEQPVLRRYAIEIYVGEYDERGDNILIEDSFQTALANAINGLALPSLAHDALSAFISTFLYDAAITLIICLCANVSTLEIDISGQPGFRNTSHGVVSESICKERFDQDSQKDDRRDWNDKGKPARPFSNLRKLKAGCIDGDMMSDASDLTGFLQLPNIEELQGHWLTCFDGFDSPMSSSIKRIELKDTIIDGPGLGKLLQACPGVTDLSIRWSFSFNGGGGRRLITSKQFHFYQPVGEALRAYGKGLDNLDLSFESGDDWHEKVRQDDGDDNDTVDYRPPTAIGSLKELESLRSLHISWTILFGDMKRSQATERPSQLSEMLPPSLQLLDVPTCENLKTTPYADVEEQIYALLGGGSPFSELRWIMVMTPKPEGPLFLAKS